MIRAIMLSLFLALALTSPAFAHKLKVFAAVEGDQIAGYGFFIGGGRAQQTAWTARTADGALIAEGTTGADGAFRLTPPPPVTSDITVTLNTEEGHIATSVLAASRFGDGDAAAPSNSPADTASDQENAAISTATSRPPSPDSAALVEAAVQRQVEPLLERIEQMDSRLRFVDIVSGIFLIVGLAGIGLWVRGRTRK